MNRPLTFFFIPADPLWPLIVIAIDLLVIWAFTAHRSEMKQAEPGLSCLKRCPKPLSWSRDPSKPVLGRVTSPCAQPCAALSRGSVPLATVDFEETGEVQAGEGTCVQPVSTSVVRRGWRSSVFAIGSARAQRGIRRRSARPVSSARLTPTSAPAITSPG